MIMKKEMRSNRTTCSIPNPSTTTNSCSENPSANNCSHDSTSSSHGGGGSRREKIMNLFGKTAGLIDKVCVCMPSYQEQQVFGEIGNFRTSRPIVMDDIYDDDDDDDDDDVYSYSSMFHHPTRSIAATTTSATTVGITNPSHGRMVRPWSMDDASTSSSVVWLSERLLQQQQQQQEQQQEQERKAATTRNSLTSTSASTPTTAGSDISVPSVPVPPPIRLDVDSSCFEEDIHPNHHQQQQHKQQQEKESQKQWYHQYVFLNNLDHYKSHLRQDVKKYQQQQRKRRPSLADSVATTATMCTTITMNTRSPSRATSCFSERDDIDGTAASTTTSSIAPPTIKTASTYATTPTTTTTITTQKQPEEEEEEEIHEIPKPLISPSCFQQQQRKLRQQYPLQRNWTIDRDTNTEESKQLQQQYHHEEDIILHRQLSYLSINDPYRY